MSCIPWVCEAGGSGAAWLRQARPLHPILVNFTAALVPASLAFDLLGAWTRRDSLRSAGGWALLLAAAVTPFTAIAGWLWLRAMGDMGHTQMPYHKWLGAAIALALIPLAAWRGRSLKSGRGPGALYFAAALVVAIAVVCQGHLGGTMSFGGD